MGRGESIGVIGRRERLARLGGMGALALMSDAAKADALEQPRIARTNSHPPFPTAAEIADKADTQPTRKGVGNLFLA
jgi:hypothetical protein